jgi:hypothetical protein
MSIPRLPDGRLTAIGAVKHQLTGGPLGTDPRALPALDTSLELV